jgi:3'-phosphoadenosine 5'-phosphosulfate sulfotransferase (PAPS reductase)/FAD synthetase
VKPYMLPPGNVQIAFSGGRTSAYMLHQIAEANGGIPERVRVVFGNTGREMPQTLDFVAEVGAWLGVSIDWVEYLPEAPHYALVSHNSAARDGEPFAALVRKRKFLPNQQARFCTQELKIRPAKRFLVSLGWQHWTSALGIRADEPGRVNREPQKERWQRWYPLADAGVSKHDVALFWRGQSFDLRLPNNSGKTVLGNCDGCFLKSEANLAGLARDYPERHQWWEDMERMVSEWTLGTGAQFSKRYSRREMRWTVENQSQLFDVEDGFCQADGGECVA